MSLKSGARIGLLLLAVAASRAPASDASADGWITLAEARGRTPVVLHFRRELELARAPGKMPVQVTADNRFILYVNGQRVASGPSTGTPESWRYSVVDLAPHLHAGHNVVAATVWNFGGDAPMSQMSVATGFRLVGGPISTTAPGWRVKLDLGHGATSGHEQMPWQYYVASTPESIDANRADWDFAIDREMGADWRDAVSAPEAAVRTLVADKLPPQTYDTIKPGRVVRGNGGNRGGNLLDFPEQDVTVPAHSTVKLLIRQDAMLSAYPEIGVTGGAGAEIQLHYSEALYDEKRHKADRDAVDDRQVLGFHDTFIADGAARTFAPLWWRTFRFLEIVATTQGEPLTLKDFRLHKTGYPFQQVAKFDSSDPELNRIWEIGWRTARVDAHETYMDSSYWEQLQYTGDTRLEMLISYAVSGDARLAEQAIDSFAESESDGDADGGLVEGRYPTREPNVIATFSFAWVGMLSDWARYQPDTRVIVRHLPRMRRVLSWFNQWLNQDEGLLTKNPQWNFIDWAGQKWDDRDTFPSWGRQHGGSCLMTAMWLGALRQGAALEQAYGDKAKARDDGTLADVLRTAIRQHCWNAERGLYADDPDLTVFSQHMNVFAVLYDIATREESRAILERITVPGHGIDAPPGMYTSTYYFAWYLARAFEHAGLADRYLELLQTWRELLKLNFTTWPESRGETRSDSHAWSAHPTADLLGVVAGIQPGAPGYARLRIEPHLGNLVHLGAVAATPTGPVKVHYEVADGQLQVDIEKPAGLEGEFVWRGRSYPIAGPHAGLRVPAE
jgi:alpha-L-rhamnosidase